MNFRMSELDQEFFQAFGAYQQSEDAGLCSRSIKGQGCLAKMERFTASRLR